MTQAPPAIFNIPTKSPQPARGKPGRPARRAKASCPATGRVVANGTGRAATRGGGEVIELEYGITVYPAREEHGRWRAVWYENGERQQCEAGTEEKLAAKLEKVTERLAADAPNMKLRSHAPHADPARPPGSPGPSSPSPIRQGYRHQRQNFMKTEITSDARIRPDHGRTARSWDYTDHRDSREL